MDNRINQVFTLENGKKFIVLHQAIYDNDNYFVCTAVTDDGEDVTEDFMLFHEIKEGEKSSVEMVEDPTLAQFIFEHLDLMD